MGAWLAEMAVLIETTPAITSIAAGLLRFTDTCNVYALLNQEAAVLIDFGSGEVLGQLADLDGRRVTDVLMTHHHRDQGQGLKLANQAGIRVWVPHTEQELFCGVEAHWQSRELRNNYNVRQDRFSLLNSVAIQGTLHDYARVEIGGRFFEVIPTPGHTTGSISLLTEIDGLKVAFTGDLIAAPGKVWSLAATQWTYNGAEGIAATIASLIDLKRRCPDMLLPSHGEPILEPGPAIDLLVERLTQMLTAREQYAWLFPNLKQPYEMITPHLFRNRTSVATSYVLRSDSGKALLIDYGYDFMTGMPAGSDRASRRPWLYTLDYLKRHYGVQQIDAAIATHYHDDHVAGFNLLREVEGAQIWAAENYANILQRPSRYNLPCLWYDPIPVDRVLPLCQPVAWQEYELTLYPLPGHTRYAVAIAFQVDGYQALATGDQYQDDGGYRWNYVYQNHFGIEDYRRSAELYRELHPELILSGHWQPMWVKPGHFERLITGAQKLERLHRELLPLQEVGPGGEGADIRFEPYQTAGCPGEILEFDLWVHNPFEQFKAAHLALVVPQGWSAVPEEASLSLKAGMEQVLQFRVQIPAGQPGGNYRLAVDVTLDERRLGQQAEALVNVSWPLRISL